VVVTELESISQTVASSIQNVVCSSDQPALVSSQASLAAKEVCGVTSLLNDVRVFFQCGNWYPVYESGVHDAMCYSSANGFIWVTITQFIIVFMAMIILTFRIVFYDIEVEPHKEVVAKAIGQDEPAAADKSVQVGPSEAENISQEIASAEASDPEENDENSNQDVADKVDVIPESVPSEHLSLESDIPSVDPVPDTSVPADSDSTWNPSIRTAK